MGKYNWSKERLVETVVSVFCWWDWLRALGIPTRGSNYNTLKSKAELYGIDTSHFDYKYSRTHNGQRILKNRNDDGVFGKNLRISNTSVKVMYIERILGGVPVCEKCGIENWNNKPIVMQLHHINGDSKDNTLENLQLLCPNCHSQTDNYRNKQR